MAMCRAVAAAASISVAMLLEGCGHHGGGGGGGDHPDAPVLPKACSTTTTTTASGTWTGYACSSSRLLKGPVKAATRKGFAVDDPTLATCSEQMVAQWPHSKEGARVHSLRLFSAWKNYWNQEERQTAWDNIKLFLDNNNAKVLLGLDMTCEPDTDKWEWEQASAMLDFLGKERVMGLAFGNEMDNKEKCRPLFKSGEFFMQMQQWVDAIDKKGFGSVPVTVVWAMGVLGKGIDTTEHSFEPELEPFLWNASKTWGKRFVWTFNPYPLWDESIKPKDAEHCSQMIEAATGDYTRNIMGVCRNRMTNFTQSEDAVMWAGESGWSSPFVVAQQDMKSYCPAWASEDTLFKFYETMMSWDLSVPVDHAGKSQKGVDHLFFFTMRDYDGESFGLIKECCASECKIQASAPTATTAAADFLAKVVV